MTLIRKPDVVDINTAKMRKLIDKTEALEKQIAELFLHMFQLEGEKKNIEFDIWRKAKFSIFQCEVGNLYQTRSNVFKRIR